MVYNKNEIMDFVKRVLGENADGIYLDEDELQEGYENSVYSDEKCSYAINEWGKDYEVSRGLTRLVIIPNDKEYVIKLPITGIYTENKKNKKNNVDENEEDSVSYNIVARADEDCDNPSEDEISIYENATKVEKQILLETIYVGIYNNIPVYIQQKVTETLCYSDHDCDDISIDSRKIIKDTIQKATNGRWLGTPCPDIFVLDIINFYGNKKAQAMLRFLYNLNDLHSNNVGYVGKRPVVIDYGGFNGEDYMWTWFNFVENKGN